LQQEVGHHAGLQREHLDHHLDDRHARGHLGHLAEFDHHDDHAPGLQHNDNDHGAAAEVDVAGGRSSPPR